MVTLTTFAQIVPTMRFREVTCNVVTDVNASAQMSSTISGQEVTFAYYFLEMDEPEFFLLAEEYPLLVDIWDNKEDAIYDLL